LTFYFHATSKAHFQHELRRDFLALSPHHATDYFDFAFESQRAASRSMTPTSPEFHD